ncbi:hypothetical protein HDU96_005529, partial [Phlyctochytrium bullatum]
CYAVAAALYKLRVDTQKPKKSVWAILSNAESWNFMLIDEQEKLWKLMFSI